MTKKKYFFNTGKHHTKIIWFEKVKVLARIVIVCSLLLYLRACFIA